MFVLDITQEDIVEHCDDIDVKNAVLEWHEKEVDELSWGPDDPVSQVYRWELFF